MILVDSSVWIGYFNGIENDETNTLHEALGSEKVAIGDLIFMEVLQGFRKDKDYNIAKKVLGSLHHFEMLGTSMAIKCSENYRALRKQGITIRKTADVIIATFCIENRIPLLFTDRDFLPFVEKLGLISAAGKT